MRLLPCLSLICVITATPVVADDSAGLNELLSSKNTAELAVLLQSMPVKKRAGLLDAKNETGDTPLMSAAKTGDLPLFDVLAKAGADPNVRDASNRDILNIAVRTSNPELAKRALQAGTDPKAYTIKYRGSALIFASDRGEVEIVEMLIKAGAPLDRINNLGWTAMLEATVLGDGSAAYVDIVRLLLEAGADQNIADRNGLSPLDHAVRSGHGDMAALLKSYQ